MCLLDRLIACCWRVRSIAFIVTLRRVLANTWFQGSLSLQTPALAIWYFLVPLFDFFSLLKSSRKPSFDHSFFRCRKELHHGSHINCYFCPPHPVFYCESYS